MPFIEPVASKTWQFDTNTIACLFKTFWLSVCIKYNLAMYYLAKDLVLQIYNRG